MSVYFYEDGTYNLAKNPMKKLAFEGIDISTDRKGPLFTLVKHPIDVTSLNIEVICDIYTEFGELDLPFNYDDVIRSTFICDTKERFYNICPLIRQMIGINQFIANQMMYGAFIEICAVDLHYGDKLIHIDEMISEKKMYKTFKYLGMHTDVSNVLKTTKYIYLSNHRKWEIIHPADVKNYSDGVFMIPFQYIESVYALSASFLHKLIDVNTVEVEVYSTSCNDETYMYFHLSDVYEILEGCIFIPQLLLIDQHLYNNDYRLYIVITSGYDYHHMDINIDSNQFKHPENNCILKILESILEKQ